MDESERDRYEQEAWLPPAREQRRPYVVEDFLTAEGLHSYKTMLDRAAADPEWFYRAAFDRLDLPWLTPFHTVLDDGGGPAWPRWFVGGRTNLSWLAIDRWVERGRGGDPALFWQGEDGAEAMLRFEDLQRLVAGLAGGLVRLGVRPGDVVGLYSPPIPEAAITVLACARIGAIVAPAFSGYGADALTERLRRSGARVLVTADAQLRRGRCVPLKPIADVAAEAAGIERMVVIDHLGEPVRRLRGRDVEWDGVADIDSPAEVVPLPAHAVCILAYTSGSTGPPKGTVHTHGGLPYRIALELALCFDVRPGDRFSWITDIGWIMGSVLIAGPLARGAASVLTSGVPDHPSPRRLWDLVREFGVTHLGLSPTLVRQLAATSGGPGARELEALRVLGLTGEPCTPDVWRWLHTRVGRGRRPIINWTGGTEVGCGLLAGSPAVRTPACRFAGPAPGIDAAVFDPQGNRLVGAPGELVIRRPWPSMTKGFWGEPERYEGTYWARFPGAWAHGDLAVEHPDGSWELLGRSDDTMKVGGKRLGPAELEAVAEEVPGVVEAAAVPLPDPIKGQIPVLVVTTTEGTDPDALAAAVTTSIEHAVGRALRPAAVLVSDELPHTRSGKLHRRAVRAWLTGGDPGDLSTLDDSGAEEAIDRLRPLLPALDSPEAQ